MGSGLQEVFMCRRRQLEDRLAASGRSHTFSLARYRLHRRIKESIHRFAEGRGLDIGSGRSPFKPLLVERCTSVMSVDVEQRSDDVDLIADVQEMPAVATDSFETVLSTQVLEHVPRPWDGLAEISRVLAPGGRLILSVPHLSAIHEAPHDYFRFTPYGLRALCADAGLEIEELDRTGGLLCFVLHGASYGLLSTLGAVPGLRWLVWLLNYVLLIGLASPVDRLLGMGGSYPCDHVLVARKPEDPERPS